MAELYHHFQAEILWVYFDHQRLSLLFLLNLDDIDPWKLKELNRILLTAERAVAPLRAREWHPRSARWKP